MTLNIVYFCKLVLRTLIIFTLGFGQVCAQNEVGDLSSVEKPSPSNSLYLTNKDFESLRSEINTTVDTGSTEALQKNLTDILKVSRQDDGDGDDGDDGDGDGAAAGGGLFGGQGGAGGLLNGLMLPPVVPQILGTLTQAFSGVNDVVNATSGSPSIPSFIFSQFSNLFSQLTGQRIVPASATPPPYYPVAPGALRPAPGQGGLKPGPIQGASQYPQRPGQPQVQGVSQYPQLRPGHDPIPQIQGFPNANQLSQAIPQQPVQRPAQQAAQQGARPPNRIRSPRPKPRPKPGPSDQGSKSSLWNIYKSFSPASAGSGALTDFQLAHPEGFHSELLTSISTSFNKGRPSTERSTNNSPNFSNQESSSSDSDSSSNQQSSPNIPSDSQTFTAPNNNDNNNIITKPEAEPSSSEDTGQQSELSLESDVQQFPSPSSQGSNSVDPSPATATQPPTNLAQATQPPTNSAPATRPPTNLAQATQPPTNLAQATQPPTNPDRATRPPTNLAQATQPPTNPARATRPPPNLGLSPVYPTNFKEYPVENNPGLNRPQKPIPAIKPSPTGKPILAQYNPEPPVRPSTILQQRPVTVTLPPEIFSTFPPHQAPGPTQPQNQPEPSQPETESNNEIFDNEITLNPSSSVPDAPEVPSKSGGSENSESQEDISGVPNNPVPSSKPIEDQQNYVPTVRTTTEAPFVNPNVLVTELTYPEPIRTPIPTRRPAPQQQQQIRVTGPPRKKVIITDAPSTTIDKTKFSSFPSWETPVISTLSPNPSKNSRPVIINNMYYPNLEASFTSSIKPETDKPRRRRRSTTTTTTTTPVPESDYYDEEPVKNRRLTKLQIVN